MAPGSRLEVCLKLFAICYVLPFVFLAITMSLRYVQKPMWQVQYYERGIAYWWEYPDRTQKELEACYQNWGDDQDRYVEYQYSGVAPGGHTSLVEGTLVT